MWAWVMTTSFTSLEPVAGALERALEVRHRAAVVHPGVDEHDPVARLQRPRVAVRDAGQLERQAQPPDPGQHALAAAHVSRVGSACARPRHATVRAMAKKDRLKAPETDTATSTATRSSLRGVAHARHARCSTRRSRAGNILSREDAWQRAVEFLFERLVVRWEIARRAADHQAEGAARALPLRLRRRSGSSIRETLRKHLAEWFPEMEAP